MRRSRRDSEAEVVETEETSETAESRPVRRPVLPAPRMPFEVHWLPLLGVIVSLAFAVVLILSNLGMLPSSVILWWPLILLIPALLWFVLSLLRRSARGLLTSTALLGIGLSLLLGTQNVATIGSTVIGIMFITVGTGILLRGLMLRQHLIS